MSADGSTLCVGCGKPVAGPTTLHHLPDGSPCPRCQERALDAQPSLLPGGGCEGRGELDPGGEAQETPSEGELGATRAETGSEDGVEEPAHDGGSAPTFRLLPRQDGQDGQDEAS